jgi:PhnB protein
MSILNPYLNFVNTARDTMTFYQSIFGGELTMSTFAELGAAADVQPDEVDLIMHSQLVTPAGYNLMASDTPQHMRDARPSETNTYVSLSGPQADNDQLRGYWTKLEEGATIEQELSVAPWGDAFGSLKDKFGQGWVINIAAT